MYPLIELLSRFLQVFRGDPEHDQEPPPRRADHRPGERPVPVSPVQVPVQHGGAPHPPGTPHPRLVSDRLELAEEE